MSLLEEKRNDLERFIQEQMIGPGGCGNKFGVDGMPNGEEVINTTPGSIYNTAILFPGKENSEELEGAQNDADDNPNNGENNDDESSEVDDKDRNTGNQDDDEGFSLERRFPQTIAISCCLAEKTNLQQDVKVTISGRYYRKIEGSDKPKVFINIPENEVQIIQELLGNETINNSFNFNKNGRRLGILFNSTNAKEVYDAVKNLDKSYASTIKRQVEGEQWGVSCNFGNVDHLYLHTCRRVLAEKLKKTDNYSIQGDIKELITRIGQLEQGLHYFEDLTQLYHNSGYGFWESETFSIFASIPDNLEKCGRGGVSLRNVLHRETKIVKEVEITTEIAASVLFQLAKDYRNPANQKKYLKVMLQNSSTPFKETQQNQYTIVNEELNKLCLFGVKIQIESEKLEPYRLEEAYNDVTAEDDCLKFLYRNIKDYGVGHLCSVDWDKNERPTKVWSEFLPSKEIPDVDFEPRNKRSNGWTSGEAPSFVENNQCLNLHFLLLVLR